MVLMIESLWSLHSKAFMCRWIKDKHLCFRSFATMVVWSFELQVQKFYSARESAEISNCRLNSCCDIGKNKCHCPCILARQCLEYVICARYERMLSGEQVHLACFLTVLSWDGKFCFWYDSNGSSHKPLQQECTELATEQFIKLFSILCRTHFTLYFLTAN